MTLEVRPYLPLKISEITWDGTSFHMYGSNWGFATLSAWRISTDSQVVLGCNDERSIEVSTIFKDLEIIEIQIQETLLKIDPVFVLSNHQKIEIFSTDTYEPWTFSVEGLGVYIATPQEPKVFDP